MWIFLALVSICFALAISNFAESSITTLSTAKLKSLGAILGKPFGEAAIRWLHHPEEYLTFLLFLQNIFESFFAWLLVIGLGFWIDDFKWRQITAWAVGTCISLFFLTLYPKLLARKISHGMIGVWILRILYIFITPFYPILRFFFYVIARVSGGAQKDSGALSKGVALSLEEIRELIDSGLSRPINPVSPTTLQMMTNYLRLGEVTIEHIMTRREHVASVDRKQFMEKALPGPDKERALFQVMTDGHTRTLVVDRDFPMGYVHAKDLLREAGLAGEIQSVSLTKILRPIPALNARQKVLDALTVLLQGIPIAYVTKEDRWVGIITVEDILEEVTGEILDEFEHRKRRVYTRSSGAV